MSDIKTIPTEEMNFFNLISIDEVGEVFEWKGRIFRGITEEAKPLVDKYFASGFLDSIVEKRLFPKTDVSFFSNPRYCYILEHERIPLQSIDAEWSFDMLKDAAILVCEIAAIAWRYGFNMKDCHTKNVLFHNNKPIYVDLGSFVEKEECASGYRSYDQLMGYYYYTLRLWSDGCIALPKQLQALYKFEKRDYLLYKNPFWRHFNRVLDKYVLFESYLMVLTYKDYRTTRAQNSPLLLFILQLINRIKIFRWQRPDSFAKMFKRIKTPQHLKINRKYGQESIINDKIKELFRAGKKTIIINPDCYGFLDAYLKEFGEKEIITVDINENRGNSNYLKYRDVARRMTNLTFNLFYPNLHYNYQTPPSQRYYADSFIIINPCEIAKELRKPVFVLYKLLLQYSFVHLVVVEEVDKIIDSVSDGIIKQWYNKTYIVQNGDYLVSEYLKI